MAYLQVDLDALDEFDGVAMKTGLTPGDVAIGLLKLWRDCFRKKTAHVSREGLTKFFRCDLDKLVEALEAGEFIDRPSGRPDLHVRGAEKRLGLLKARSAGGKKAAGNLKQNRTGSAPAEHRLASGSPPAQAGAQPEVQPVVSSGSTPGLTASSQQPAANKVEEADFALESQGPTKPARKQSAQQEFAGWFAEQRKAVLGDAWVGDKHIGAGRLNKALAWIADYDDAIVVEAAELYLADPYRQTQDPPFRLDYFALDHAEYVSKAMRRGAA